MTEQPRRFAMTPHGTEELDYIQDTRTIDRSVRADVKGEPLDTSGSIALMPPIGREPLGAIVLLEGETAIVITVEQADRDKLYDWLGANIPDELPEVGTPAEPSTARLLWEQHQLDAKLRNMYPRISGLGRIMGDPVVVEQERTEYWAGVDELTALKARISIRVAAAGEPQG